MAIALSELALRLGASLAKASAAPINRLATLEHACPGDLSFLPGHKYRKRLRTTQATAVIVGCNAQYVGCENKLVVRDALIGCARAAQWLPLADKEWRSIGRLGASRRDFGIEASATVHPSVIVGKGVVIGAHTDILPGCVLGNGARIADYCRIGPNVTLSGCAAIGKRVMVHAGAVIGKDGFAYVRDGPCWLKLPSFGGVTLGDDVEVGANCTIDRGVLSDTMVLYGAKLDNHVHLAHDVHIGHDTAIAAHAAVAGGTSVGNGCLIGGAAGIGEGLRIADGVTITGMSMVTKSILEENGSYSSGWPAQASRSWWRQIAIIRRRLGTSSNGSLG